MLGVAGSAIAAAVLLGLVVPAGNAVSIAGATVYCIGLVAMFGLSAAYNLTVRPGWKETLRRCDHAAIFLMIAGTYTPIGLVALAGTLGTVLLAAVWLVAVLGAVFKLLRPRRHERASVAVYLLLGWLGLPALGSLVAALPTSGLLLLGLGGVLYTIGVAFHLWERLPQHNALWHASVLAAAGCHYAVVLRLLVGT